MPPTAVRYGPPRVTGPVLLLLALALGLLGLGSDAPGRLLLGIAVVGLLGAAGWTLGGPAVAADTSSLTVRGAVRRHQLPWAAVAGIHADTRRRSRAVEIETAGALFAVPAVLLGRASPGEVVAALSALREQSPPAPGPAPAAGPGPAG